MSGLVDTHVHFWDESVLDYPWLASTALPRQALPEHHRADANARVAAVVVVEANPAPAHSEAELGWLAGLATSGVPVVGVVAQVDLREAATVAAAVHQAAATSLVKGVRWNLEHEPAGACAARLEALPHVGEAGLPFDLCIRRDQLAEIVPLVGRLGDVRLVVDHMGAPPWGAPSEWPQWQRGVRALAGAPNVACKISGASAAATHVEIAAACEEILEAFGTERVLYGSDWPVTPPSVADRLLGILTERLATADADGLLGANARTWYRLA